MKFERGQDPQKVLGLGMEEVIDKFLTSVSQRSSNKSHQLHIAATFGQMDIVSYLINNGIDPKTIDLQTAINRGHINIIKLMLDHNPSLHSNLTITKLRWKKMDPEIKKLVYHEL